MPGSRVILSRTVAAFLIAAASPTESRAAWSQDLAPKIEVFTDHGIVTVSSFEGAPVLAGCFAELGGRRIGRIARWDGSLWQPFGHGLDTVWGVAVWRGRLLACGAELGIHGDHIRGVAEWTGTEWRQLGDGLPQAHRMIVFDDHLYAFGCWGPGANSVWRLAGKSWERLPPLPNEDQPFCAAVVSNALWVGTATSGIQRWEGHSWTSVGLQSDGAVGRICVLDSAIVAGVVREDPSTRMETIQTYAKDRADGDWRRLELPRDGDDLRLLCTWRDSALFSRRGTALYSWSEAGFDSIPLPYPCRPLAAAEVGTQLWMVVMPSRGGGDHVIVWDGTRWDLGTAGEAPNDYVKVLLSDGGRLLVAGSFNAIGSARLPGLAAWNGRSWSEIGADTGTVASAAIGSPTQAVRSGSAMGRFRGDLVVAGGLVRASRPDLVPRLLRRIGADWTEIGGKAEYRWCEQGPDAAVSEILEIEEGLVVAGGFSHFDGVELNGIGLWDGAVWRKLGPVQGCSGESYLLPKFTHLARFQDGIIALGRLQIGAEEHHIGWWRNGAWDFMKGGVKGSGLVLQPYGDELVVAGAFEEAGGRDARNIAAWDGGTWHPLGDGLPGTVTAMALHRERLVAAVRDRSTPRIPRSSLYSWTGKAWEPFAGGARFDGTINTLCEHQGDLWVGGEFGEVNGIPSAFLARWLPE